MKLYIYDHCPFCVRARMAAGLFGADVEEVVMANDDEATPIGMIGAKQVPILQKEDGSFMGESLDIVRYLDRIHEDLNDLDGLMHEISDGINGEIGMEDILVFPILRNLTVVRGIEWPQKVMGYLMTMSEKSGVPLYFDRAL